MIVVTTGTNEQPFDRLVRAAAQLSPDEPLLVQYGASREAHGPGTWIDYMSFDALAEAMRQATVVVSHAGVGSIMLARRCGRVPIVVPRRVSLGEAVDDHQLHLARRLDAIGAVRLVEDDERLAEAIAALTPVVALDVIARGGPLRAGGGILVDELAQFFGECAARPVAAHGVTVPA